MTHRFRTAFLPIALLLTLAPTVARAQIEEPRIPLQTKLSELNRFRAEYAENFNKHDVAAVTAMYSPTAMIVTNTGTVVSGREQISQWTHDASP